jgi:hypothetical protein
VLPLPLAAARDHRSVRGAETPRLRDASVRRPAYRGRNGKEGKEEVMRVSLYGSLVVVFALVLAFAAVGLTLRA